MTDLMPKLTDVKSLQDLSKILAWPMLVVAYFLVTGPQITWDGEVWFGTGDGLPVDVQTRPFFSHSRCSVSSVPRSSSGSSISIASGVMPLSCGASFCSP